MTSRLYLLWLRFLRFANTIDLDAAKSLGHRALWARGLGSRAPLTVGRCQWEGARGLIERICLDASAAS